MERVSFMERLQDYRGSDNSGVSRASTLEAGRHPQAAPLAEQAGRLRQVQDDKPAPPPFDSKRTEAGQNPKLRIASEVFVDEAGRTKEIPLSPGKLAPGDHTIKLANDREFMMHIPANDGKALPVVFVISPSVNAHLGFKPEYFGPETGMSQAADKSKFIAVYPMPVKHLLGVYSKTQAYAWNAEGSGIDAEDRRYSGYNDVDFIKSVADLLPQVANTESTHKNWGAIAFSQGGMFLNELAHEVPGLFPTIGLVGTTMETGHDYTTANDNARNVMIVNLRADRAVLPFPGAETGKYQALKLWMNTLAAVSPRAAKVFAEQYAPLGAIDNRRQNPNLMKVRYEQNLEEEGPCQEKVFRLDTPVKSDKKDMETVIKPLDPENHGAVYIFDLPEAVHAYPGPDRGSRVNPDPKYTEFDTTAKFVELFDCYNEAVSRPH
jgi:poly(3-hydroxybutyrate) depolymerase